jgi:hypothetical protein
VDGAHQVGVEGFVALAEHERPQRTLAASRNEI